MDTKKLDALLKKSTVPEPSPQVKDEQLYKARLAFLSPGELTAYSSRGSREAWKIFQAGILGAAVCLGIFFLVLESKLLSQPPPISSALASTEHALFQSFSRPSSQSLAIAETLQAYLTEDTEVDRDTNVLIEIRKNGKKYFVIGVIAKALFVRGNSALVEVVPERTAHGNLQLRLNGADPGTSGSVSIDGMALSVRPLL